MNMVEIRIAQYIEVKIKTNFLRTFKRLTIFDNWIIDQLNQLMNLPRHTNMVEAKMAHHIEGNLKNTIKVLLKLLND